MTSNSSTEPQNASTRANAPIRVLLYTLFTSSNQLLPIHRSRSALLRNRINRAAHLTYWKISGRWQAPHWLFEDVANSNLGDVAVRMGVSKALNEAFGGRTLDIVELPWGKLTPDFLKNNNFDLIVIGGGGYLFANANGQLPKRFLDDVDALHFANCPIVATSIGINQLIQQPQPSPFVLANDQIDSVRRFANALSLISVRDDKTSMTIGWTGVTPPPVIVDPAYLLAEPNPISKNDDVLDIGLNLACHGPFAAELSKRNLPILFRVLKKLKRSVPCRFHYFCHADSSKGIASAIQARGIDLNVVGGSVERLLAGYQKLDVHTGSLMHSTILATSVGVPSLSMAYDIKSSGFFDLIGLERLVINAQSMTEDTLYASILDLIARRKDIANTIQAGRVKLQRESEAFFAKVAELVIQSGRVGN